MRADVLEDSFLQREPQSQEGPRRESWRPTSLGRSEQEGLRGEQPRRPRERWRWLWVGGASCMELPWLQEEGTVVGKSRSRGPHGEAAGRLQGRG